jgi:hypothetical protein
LPNGIDTHCCHRNEYGEIADNHTGKDSRSHPAHALP